MTETKPRWIDAYQTKTGLPDPRRVGMTARPAHCRDCGLLVLAGYDAPMMAALAIVDPYRLSPLLEVAAVIVDRPTYRLHGNPGRYELQHRTPQHPPMLQLLPADQCVVVAAHHCGRPPLSKIPLPVRAKTWTVDSDGPPPF